MMSNWFQICGRFRRTIRLFTAASLLSCYLCQLNWWVGSLRKIKCWGLSDPIVFSDLNRVVFRTPAPLFFLCTPEEDLQFGPMLFWVGVRKVHQPEIAEMRCPLHRFGTGQYLVLPCTKITCTLWEFKVAIENDYLLWVFPLKMVIIYSYLSLPKGYMDVHPLTIR